METIEMDANKTRVVIKFGGHALDDPELNSAFCQNLVFLRDQAMEFVIVHGVRDFLRAGLPAAGISGMDGKLLQGKIKNPALGYVGGITSVNPAIVNVLLESGFLPVIAPLALDPDCHPLNVNADTSAGAIAGALEADFFVLISDVPGVLDGDGKLLGRLDWPEIENLRAKGVITGGMIPKTQCCRTALDGGCKKAIILDGRAESGLKKFLLDGEPLGTVIEL